MMENTITQEFIKGVHQNYKRLQDNLTDKDIVKDLYVKDWLFHIYKVKNKYYGNIDDRKYIFFASGYHSKEGLTTKRINIRSLQSIRNIEIQIKNTFKLWNRED